MMKKSTKIHLVWVQIRRIRTTKLYLDQICLSLMGSMSGCNLATLSLLLSSAAGVRLRPRASTARCCATTTRKNPALYTEAVTSAQALAKLKLERPPSLLAPAGGWPQLITAVNSGADACYFGVRENFNARARATNFGIDELPDVMAYLRAHNVKGYCTVNVLIFEEELEQVETLIRALASAGVSALIVQDVGAIRLCREIAPHLPVHASTQMSITSAEGAEFARELGCERVVVGRELSLKEIDTVVDGTPAEVEAFVHGALCVSYSGQCFSSEAWGGRSANRGQCAQACRMPYGLLVNGSLAHLGDVQYLLSPQDFSGLGAPPIAMPHLSPSTLIACARPPSPAPIARPVSMSIIPPSP